MERWSKSVKIECCSVESLTKLLDHQLDAAQEDAVVKHLSGCLLCRDRLERITAEPKFWQTVGEQFRSVDQSPDYQSNKSPDDLTIRQGEMARSLPAESSLSSSDRLGLNPSEITDSGTPTAHDSHSIDQRPSSHVAAIHFIKQLLHPTDDPSSLGRLGVYEVTGIIGVGGMGIVLKGLDVSLQRSVAIKVLAPHLTTSGAARQRFAREAQAAASVVHENVMAIHAIDQCNGVPYFVMPLVRGESLEKRLVRAGPMDVLEILRIGRQVAAGLAAAHQQGLVHRDIKPANILMEHGSERLKIADFGLARAGDDASLTRSGHIIGTPLYMSPEQARGEPVDSRSDIFSFGALLYALSTGHPPFRAETPYGVIRRLCEEEPRAIQEFSPNIPFWLSGIIERMMSKLAEDRFKDANELVELFASGLVYLQRSVPSPLPKELSTFVKVPSLDSHLPSWSRGWSKSKTGVAVALLFLIGVSSYIGWVELLGGKVDPSNVGPNVGHLPNTNALAMADDPLTSELQVDPPIADVDENAKKQGANAQDTKPQDEKPQDEGLPVEGAGAAQVDRELQPVQVVKQPRYNFQLGQPLKYKFAIELDSLDKQVMISGNISLKAVEVEDGYAELDYEIGWDNAKQQLARIHEGPFFDTSPFFGSTTFTSRVQSSHPLGSMMIAEHLEMMMHIPRFPFSSPEVAGPFGFEREELQNCELVGRAKIGVEGKLVGSSHRSEFPGQWGRVLEWVFPAIAGDDKRSWNTEADIVLMVPNPSNVDDWKQRKRLKIRRIAEFEVRPEEGQPDHQLNVQFVVTDTPSQPGDASEVELQATQTLLGSFQFDKARGCLKKLTAIRSNLEYLQSESYRGLRPAKLLIERVDLNETKADN
jgi:serine/threonine protein kinase